MIITIAANAWFFWDSSGHNYLAANQSNSAQTYRRDAWGIGVARPITVGQTGSFLHRSDVAFFDLVSRGWNVSVCRELVINLECLMTLKSSPPDWCPSVSDFNGSTLRSPLHFSWHLSGSGVAWLPEYGGGGTSTFSTGENEKLYKKQGLQEIYDTITYAIPTPENFLNGFGQISRLIATTKIGVGRRRSPAPVATPMLADVLTSWIDRKTSSLKFSSRFLVSSQVARRSCEDWSSADSIWNTQKLC